MALLGAWGWFFLMCFTSYDDPARNRASRKIAALLTVSSRTHGL